MTDDSSSRSAIVSRGAMTRRRSTTITARSCASNPTGVCHPTTRSPGAPARCPRSGVMAIATCRAPRCTRKPASCGLHEHGPQGGDEVNVERGRPQLRLARHHLRRRIRDRPRRSAKAPPRRAWNSRSSIGCRRSRRAAWRSSPASAIRAGRATCSSAHCAAGCSCACSSTAGAIVKQERLLQDLRERIRDVRQGPDG